MKDGIEGEVHSELSPQLEEVAEEDKMPEMIPVLDHGHAPHGHGSGIPWLDIIVSVSAIFISVVSLVVSIEHGRTMEKMVDQNQKMVEANTLPLLTMDTTLTNDPSHPENAQLKMELRNSGIGPAMIDWFELSYKGKSYGSDSSMQGVGELLKECCGSALPKSGAILPSRISGVTGRVLPARDSILVFGIAPKTPGMLAALMDAEEDVKKRACYCSVLDECWETNFDHKRPLPVKECKVSPDEKLW
jgi:hypothetical protein